MMVLSRENKMARRRYQHGSLKDDGDRWVIRWREDLVADGKIKRIHRWDVLSKKAYPSKRLAQRKFDEILAKVNDPDYRPLSGVTFAQFAERWQKTIYFRGIT
jgi:hypothetical protein